MVLPAPPHSFEARPYFTGACISRPVRRPQPLQGHQSEASASRFSAWDLEEAETVESCLSGTPWPLPVQTSATCPPALHPFLPTWCHPRSSGLHLEPAAPRDAKGAATSAMCLSRICCRMAGNPPSCGFVRFQRPLTALGGGVLNSGVAVGFVHLRQGALIHRHESRLFLLCASPHFSRPFSSCGPGRCPLTS